jgi:hypothetical protein
MFNQHSSKIDCIEYEIESLSFVFNSQQSGFNGGVSGSFPTSQFGSQSQSVVPTSDSGSTAGW